MRARRSEARPGAEVAGPDLDGAERPLLTAPASGTGRCHGRHGFSATEATEAAGTSTPPELVAYDPVTGDVAFRVQYPEGISQMGVADRHPMGYDAATDEYVPLG